MQNLQDKINAAKVPARDPNLATIIEVTRPLVHPKEAYGHGKVRIEGEYVLDLDHAANRMMYLPK